MTKSPKGVLLASDSMEMQVQGQTNATAGSLVERDHSIYSIPATHDKLAGKSRHSFLVGAENDASDRENCEICTTIYCRKCYVGLCVGWCFELN
jgi:hypothetical protein